MTNPIFSHPAFSGAIGVGRADITPPVGIYARSWGAARHDVAEGIHRPLTVTALTLQTEHGSEPLYIVSLDLGWWQSLDDERELRSSLLEALGIDAERLLLHLSHTHAGPALCSGDADKPGGALIAPYFERVRAGALEAARAALGAAETAVLEWHYGRCDLACNREFPDPDKPRILTGSNPLAVADDTVLVGRVTAEDGRQLATIVNYACHPTTLAWDNRLISPDYVGAMREIVEHGDNGLCVFLQGASGDLGPREGFVGDTAIADRNGRALGLAVLAALAAMLPPRTILEYGGAVESGAPIATWKRAAATASSVVATRVVTVPLELKELPSLQEIQAESAACTDRALGERLKRKERIRRAVGEERSFDLPVWMWRFGDTLLVATRDEAYSALQIELRSLYPDMAVVVMNLTNGSFGYLPPAEIFGQDNYMVWQTPYAPGCAEALRDTLVRELPAMLPR